MEHRSRYFLCSTISLFASILYVYLCDSIPVHILSHVNPVLTTPFYFRSILILSTRLRLRLLSRLFTSALSACLTIIRINSSSKIISHSTKKPFGIPKHIHDPDYEQEERLSLVYGDVHVAYKAVK
jgi:hypothetical protein